ncbi:TadE family type IV pilus minor pilin [Actinoplanes sp. NPDC049668]|uniref:TadE family type IV pilus minor pilin n=1 Tax=unclassified Actinoplanes TaxID=2626549 RepID=UPI0033AC2C98
MKGRRWPVRLPARGRDRGAFTAELAAGLPALMLLLFAGLTAVGAVTTKGRCVDAAREGALLAARGGPGTENAARIAPAGAEITLSGDADAVTVTVRAPVPILGAHLPSITVEASATAAREPDGTGSGGAGAAAAR